MKTIGLLGGMSWESTASYYQIINETIQSRLGGLHSAKLLLYSVDFAPIEELQAQGEWEKAAAVLAEASLRLEAAGADFLVLCTNTMHKIAPRLQARLHIPLLHIGDVTARELSRLHIQTAALLGTAYTMTETFYIEKLQESGIRILVPEADDIRLVNRIIFQELCAGICSSQSRESLLRVIHALAGQGAEGVILGCTELGLLVSQEDLLSLPVLDTARLHAEAAALCALSPGWPFPAPLP